MESQFKDYKTFFDLGINDEEDSEKIFATLFCIMGGAHKKRSDNNKMILKYLRGENLTEEEKRKCADILSGKIYKDIKAEYEHCQLCSDNFVRDVLENLSSKYKHWEICCPTHPYTPAGLMIYLKNRKNSKMENIQDLNEEQFKEIQLITTEIYEKLNNRLGNINIVGINVLFNQISKSQLCIHGHMEFMIKDVQNQKLGCTLKEKRPKDLMTYKLNEQIGDRDGLLKTQEGIRIDLSKISIIEALQIVRDYEKNIEKVITYGEKLRESGILKEPIDEILLRYLSPAPQNYIYLTYYRDKMFLSCVPELILERADIHKIDENDECELYSLKINQNAVYTKDMLLNQESPIVRPSIKTKKTTKDDQNVKRLRNTIVDVLERE